MKKSTRLISLLLSIVILLGCLPVTSLAAGQQISVGQHVSLGKKDGRDLSWEILAIENGKALLFSDYVLDLVTIPKRSSADITYCNSVLSGWCQNLLKTAFTEEEQDAIYNLFFLNKTDCTKYVRSQPKLWPGFSGNIGVIDDLLYPITNNKCIIWLSSSLQGQWVDVVRWIDGEMSFGTCVNVTMYSSVFGACPAITLELDKVEFVGKGTADSPYTLSYKNGTGNSTEKEPDAIVSPVSINLSNIEQVENTASYATYKIHAMVKNTSTSKSITNVTAEYSADNSVFLNGSKIQTISTIKPLKTAEFVWTVQIDKKPFADGGVYQFVVGVGSDQTASRLQAGVINLEATNNQSNELDFTIDTWGFKNFSDGDKTPCPITETDLKALLSGLTSTEQNNLKQVFKKGFGGHCYGMSTTVILNKMNALDLLDFTGSDTVRSAVLNQNSTHSIIGYWHSTQFMKVPCAVVQQYMSLQPAEQLALLAEKADAVKNGGCPVLFSFGVSDWGAHAVVAYAMESGSFTSSTSGKTYNRRVDLYDCNAVNWNENYCLLFNAGTGEWEIPAYYKVYVSDKKGNTKKISGAASTNSGAYLKRCASTLDTINVKDYYAGHFNYLAEIRCQNDTKLKLQGQNTSAVIDGNSGVLDANKKIIAYHDDGTVETGGIGSLHVVLPDKNDCYTVTVENGGHSELNLSVLYDDEYLSIDAVSANGIEFAKGQAFSLLDNKGEFSASIADDTVSSGKFNTYDLSGSNKGDLSFAVSNKGLRVSGDNLSGLVVEAQNGTTRDQVILSCDDTSALVSQNRNKLNVVGSFRIELDANGGTISPSAIITGSDGKLDFLPTPTRSGYTFDGWFTAKTGGTRVTTSTVFSADTTVYAHWNKTGKLPFTDVTPSDWSYNDISYVWENGLMKGTSDTTFAPRLTTSRAMIVTILYRLENEPTVNSPMSFDDVKSGQWYTEAIRWAQSTGIVNGYSDEKFGPNDSITREQMAAILCRYANHKGYDVSKRADLSRFTDAGKVSTWAAAPMAWANGNGLVNGVSSTTLVPQGNATREQVAAILHRFCETFTK